MSTETDLSWIVPGAEVVTYRVGRTERYDHAAATTILRVSKRSFTVQDGSRYDLESQSRPGESTWTNGYRCVPCDSDKGRDVLANLDYQRNVRCARAAMETWRRDPTREHRLELIAALQAIDETHA